MRKFNMAFIRNPNSPAFLASGFPFLPSSPEAAEVGACKLIALSMLSSLGASANVRKSEIGCASLHSEISTSITEKARPTSAKAKETSAKADEISTSVPEKKRPTSPKAERKAKSGTELASEKAEEAASHAELALREGNAVRNAATDSAEKVDPNSNKELSEWFAKLDISTFRMDCRWEETAYKLLNFGIPSAHVKAMLPKCRTSRCGQNVESTLKRFTMLGMSHEQMGRVISQCPSILSISNKTFQSKVDFFESVGIDRCSLGKVLHRAFSAFNISLSTLQARAEFWKYYFQDVDENALLTLITRNPQILQIRLQTAKQNVAYLEEQGSSKKLLLRAPTILGHGVHAIAMKLNIIEQLGITNRRSRAGALSALHSLSICKIQDRVHNLLALGFSLDQVRKILLSHPHVLCHSEDHISLRLGYAVNVMNLSFDMIVACPAYWSYSFEKRIKYRYGVLQELKTLGAYERNICLSYMISMSNADFSRRFVKRLQAYTEHSII